MAFMANLKCKKTRMPNLSLLRIPCALIKFTQFMVNFRILSFPVILQGAIKETFLNLFLLSFSLSFLLSLLTINHKTKQIPENTLQSKGKQTWVSNPTEQLTRFMILKN